MSAAALAVVLYLVYLALALGLRTWLLYRQTGATGYNGLSGRTGSAGWWGSILFAFALLAGVAAPSLQLLRVLDPVGALDNVIIQAIGLVLALIGCGATLRAQQTMGKDWRIGVNENDTTDLVRAGIFTVVRNPIFTAMLITAAGLTLLAPNPFALFAVLVLFVAIELQVRLVEEPYLARTHGAAYDAYTGDVGRFLPGIGKPRHNSGATGS